MGSKWPKRWRTICWGIDRPGVTRPCPKGNIPTTYAHEIKQMKRGTTEAVDRAFVCRAIRTCTTRRGNPFASCLSGILSQNFKGRPGNRSAFFSLAGLAHCPVVPGAAKTASVVETRAHRRYRTRHNERTRNRPARFAAIRSDFRLMGKHETR
jgi:hypothetical protein